jgi:8-amino-7-oxononanoate synthase
LASFTGREAALAFSTGYQANLGVVTALSDSQTLVVSDAHVHASLVDACRLARYGERVVVPHNDVEAVRQVLQQRSQPRALVVVESLYSVLGDAAPLGDLAQLCSDSGAVLVVDEAHAIGVCGRGGRGLVEANGLSPRRDIVSTMTLSKSLASQGGAVLGSQAVVDHLVNTARTFIYDTGLSPVSAAAALASVGIVETQPSLPQRTLELAGRIAAPLGLAAPAGSLLSMPMGSPEAALQAQAQLAADGFLVGCFRPPSVPDGVSRLRLTSRASLADADVDRVVEHVITLAPHR